MALSEAGSGPVDTSGIAVSSSGCLYVVDLGRDRISEMQLEPQLWPVDIARP